MDTEDKAQPATGIKVHSLLTGRYRWFALSLLVVIYAFNFLDRQIFSMLQEAMKEELNLSDTQLGFCSGLAFALFYATFGIPIARFADRHNRSRIIAASLALWSIMTALCGAAQGFVSLALARVGVGVGEAGCSPPAHSMIADYFGRHERSTALAIYQCGVPIGMGLGFLAGGFINLYLGWRAAFMIVGLPGIILAILVTFFLKEPPRGLSENRAVDAAKPIQPPFFQSALHLWKNHTFRNIMLATALVGFVNTGANSWIPSFFLRTYDVDTGTLSVYLALGAGLIGGISTLLSGFLGDYMTRRDVRWMCWLPVFAFLLAKVFFVSMLFQNTFAMAMTFYFLVSFVGSLHIGSMFALVQGLAPLSMRALAVSFFVLATHLIGTGLGPLGIGISSDFLASQGVENTLKWSMLLVNLFAAWAIYHFYAASRTVREDLKNALAQNQND